MNDEFEEDMLSIDEMITTKYDSFMDSDSVREEIATLIVKHWKEIKRRCEGECR